MVRGSIFMSWNVVLWVILDVNRLHRFRLMATYLVLLQIKLCTTIILIMRMSYKVNLVSFWCVNLLWVNYAQIIQ